MSKTKRLKNLIYHSTNLKSEGVSFSEALLKGLAPDGGLYMPDSFPVLTKNELAGFSDKKYFEIAFAVLNKLIGNEVSEDSLYDLCREAYYFDVPLENVVTRRYIMRLDQGPTASFKDFAARMMSRLMQYFLSLSGRHLTILTATSGDTGSAVASAFYGLPNISVIILYPSAEVTEMQRRQMTTLDDNIQIIAIDGKFDDCQRLVKQAFVDPELSSIPLSSANSINIGRLLPQSVYYFYAWSRLAINADEKIVFSVPSGNFGNLMGGLIARQMGLPVEKFIIATNANDEVPEFLRTGIYKSINPSINCISSAMNVGHPSNLARIVSLYGGMMDEKGNIRKDPDMNRMKADLEGISVTDDETREIISEVSGKYGIILEPHGAVAWLGITRYLKSIGINEAEEKLCVSLETAHPAKFPEELRQIIKTDPVLPDSLAGLHDKAEKYTTLDNKYELLREYILRHH
jgi:threonine synthase